ncbi:hypothetical protein E4U55_006247 [Claviceps digitariae]|nr:hypothetical protein E4U55_006247 [Claviceps digitariae]
MVSHDESENEDLKYAIALSLQQQPETEQTQQLQQQDGVSDPIRPNVKDSSFTLLSLDRKRMEDERLARLAAKRTRTNSEDDDDVVEIPAPKRGRKLHTNRPNDHASIPYPDGVVKRTWALGYDRSDDDIKIEEILQKDNLLLAFFSSFQWDESWLFGKINISQTKVMLAVFEANKTRKELMRKNAPDNVKFCFPPMQGRGCMHSKLQILKFPNYLRIVVPTGNLVRYDWGETGLMENMVFLIDLPLLSDDSKPPQMTLFQTRLKEFLQAMGVEAGMIASLSKYDFAKTADLGFVYSIPGGALASSPSPTGLACLGTTIAALGLASPEPIEVDYTCASLGAIKYDFLKSLYRACQGRINEDLFGTDQGTKSKNNHDDDDDGLQVQQNFRIYFPTHGTVDSSRGGTRALMGSIHNFRSRVVRDKASGERTIVCRNWECGVVVPVRTAPEQTSAPDMEMSIFKGTVPIPMQVPGRQYSRGERPWFFRSAWTYDGGRVEAASGCAKWGAWLRLYPLTPNVTDSKLGLLYFSITAAQPGSFGS